MARVKAIYLAILSTIALALLLYFAYASYDRFGHRPPPPSPVTQTIITPPVPEQDFSAGNSTLGVRLAYQFGLFKNLH